MTLRKRRMKKGPELRRGLSLAEREHYAIQAAPRIQRKRVFHAVGTKQSLDSQGVSYKSCRVADANLDHNRAARHEFCEFMPKCSGVLRMGNMQIT
jgi:hypothetical protein